MTPTAQTSQQLFRKPDEQIWSPALFEKVLGISESEMALALGVPQKIMRLQPGDEVVQKKLDLLAEVFDQLLGLNRDTATAAFHLKNTPIRVLNYRTLFEVLRDNDAERALRYLQTISAGQSG